MKFSLTKTKRIATLLTWILIYLSILPMQLSNSVLCISADGHIAFEASIDGYCPGAHALDSDPEEITHAEVIIETDHCGSCIDLAIFPALNTKLHLVSVDDAPTRSPALPSAALAYQKRTSTILTFTPVQYTPSLINATLIYLRTTTLLI